MSVSILEVLENAGYDVKNNVEDARWLLSQEGEFYDLLERADRLVDEYSDYKDFIDVQEDLGIFDNLTFEEWRKEKEDGDE